MSGRARANGEGSIYPYRGGWAAYVWVTTPAGRKTRKYLYGQDRDELHDRWTQLQVKARKGPVASKIPTLAQYVDYWLREVIEPNTAPSTYEKYEILTRRYVVPGLGYKRLDRIQARDVQTWINRLPKVCQCCHQGKDAAREESRRRCCAVGECCQDYVSISTVSTIRNCLRSVLTHAKDADEYVSRNVAALVKLPAVRARKNKAWSTEEARRFLQSARDDGDPFYTAYVLVLVLGLRKGELLGIGWDDVDWKGWHRPCAAHREPFCTGCREQYDPADLAISYQVQRVGRRLLRREVKTDASEDGLPLPEICVIALRLRKTEQAEDRARLERETGGRGWQNWANLVFTTRFGTAIEPRNFNRSWDLRCEKAGVRKITVHDARRTCATLLVDLDVHPRVIMKILRHANFSITMEIYSQASSKATREALKRLGESLG